MKQVLCSTGALTLKVKNVDSDFLKKISSKLDCDGFELMVDSSMYMCMDELLKVIKDSGINIPVIHSRKSLGESLSGIRVKQTLAGFDKYIYTEEEDHEIFENGKAEFQKNLVVANAVGAEKMVLHLWNGIASDQNVEKNLERFGVLNDMAKKSGVTLMAENVLCNTKDPLTNLSNLRKYCPYAHFVYDTKMAEFHGQTLKVFEPEYEWMIKDGHIKHLHINDYDGGYMDWTNFNVLPIGKGHVDFDGFFSKLAGYDYNGDFTVEATSFKRETGEIDFDSLNKCFADLRNLIKKYL